MKKNYRHDIFDETSTCPKCNKPLKKRMVEAKKATPLCYGCYCKAEALRGHTINTKPRQARIETGIPVKRFI